MSAFSGPCLGVVVDNVDPDDGGRVRIRLAESDGDIQPIDIWARVVTPVGGPALEALALPAVGDNVLVVFELGDTNAPYVIGRLWNKADAPPNGANENNPPTILRSRAGITLAVDEAPGQQRVSLETPAGQKVAIDAVRGEIEILDPFGNTIRLSATGILLESSATVTINAATTLQLTAGVVRIDAGTVICSGTVQCDTLVSKSVASASYSPGAGNIW